MKKATNILLLISLIVSFILAGIYLVTGLIDVFNTSEMLDFLKLIIDEGAESKELWDEIVDVIKISVFISGILLIIAGIIAIPTAIICGKCKKEIQNGTSKNSLKGKAVLLIILGAFSMTYVPIAAGIMMLIMKPNCYGYGAQEQNNEQEQNKISE